MWKLRHKSGKRRSGSALVGLIIVILLVVIVAGVQWYLKITAKDPDTYDGLTPWKEWRLRESSQKPQEKPSEEQVKLTEALDYDSNVSVKNGSEPRGEIRFVINPKGFVIGTWYGQYHKTSTTHFQIMDGEFAGRIYPAKIHRDENGKEDPSQLYFMAKGNFMVQESNFEKGTVFNRGGEIYIRGWVSPDYASTGEITITSDKKYSEIFTWQASRPVNKIPAKL